MPADIVTFTSFLDLWRSDSGTGPGGRDSGSGFGDFAYRVRWHDSGPPGAEADLRHGDGRTVSPHAGHYLEGALCLLTL